MAKGLWLQQPVSALALAHGHCHGACCLLVLQAASWRLQGHGYNTR